MYLTPLNVRSHALQFVGELAVKAHVFLVSITHGLSDFLDGLPHGSVTLLHVTPNFAEQLAYLGHASADV